MNESNAGEPVMNAKQEVFRWVMSQGASTILLMLIAFGVWQGFPVAIDKIESGFTRNADQLERAFETQSETVERVLRVVERDAAERRGRDSAGGNGRISFREYSAKEPQQSN